MRHDPALVAEVRAWLSKAVARAIFEAALSRLPSNVRP